MKSYFTSYYQRNKERIRLRAKAYRARTAEAIRKYRQTDKYRALKKSWDTKYYSANKERIRANVRAYATANRERINSYSREWKRRNKGKYLDTNARYRRENRERRRLYNKRFFELRPGLSISYEQTYRARKKVSYIEFVDASAIYDRDAGLCQICGLPVELGEFHLDHRKPISKGGEHSYDNCQTAHASCNFRKSNKLPGECAHLWMR